jgi:glycosyltransferase involved in cell wall biosynthesis
MELISVIIPVYNVAACLARCVESVIGQTYGNLEIILVDDGSTDRSGAMCDQFAARDSRIRVIHKPNGGLSDARNAGIDIARGEYLTFIDSDDSVECDYVAYLYELVCAYGTKMSICSHRVVYENGTVLEKQTGERGSLDRKVVLERILYDEDIDLSAWAKLYHRSLFDSIRFPVGRLFEDAATTYRFVYESGQIALGSVSKLNYMIRGNSISNAGFTRKKMDLITSTAEMAAFCVEKYPDLEKAALRRLTYAYLSTLSQLANSQVRDKQAQKELMGFIRKHGFSVLMDPRSKTRDKLGIASTFFGFHFYRFIWNFYRKLTGRI